MRVAPTGAGTVKRPSYDLDHVAIATWDARPVLEQLVMDLGATPLYGANARGFRWVLLHAGSEARGMLLEVLDPWRPDQDPFLVRFLESKGEGAHHLTFKSTDIRASVREFERSGRGLVDQRFSDPRWREAFIRPRDAYGTVVQIAETTILRPPVADMLEAVQGEPNALASLAGGVSGEQQDAWWPVARSHANPATLVRVAFGVGAPSAVPLYEELLGGQRVESGDQGVVELAWRGGGRIRFEDSADAGGITALEFEPAPIATFYIGRTALRFGSPA